MGVFCSLYIAETSIRIIALGREFWGVFNTFDAIVVLCAAVETLILPLAVGGDLESANFSMIRMAKVFRIARVFRIFQYAGRFQGLRVLLRTLYASMASLVWSVVLC